ncbi:TRAP transporter large permease [Chloroflexota bacterium]
MEATPVLGLLGFALVILLLFLKVPIGFACAFVGLLGLWVIKGLTVTLESYGYISFFAVQNYALSVVPIFVWIGSLAFFSGLGVELFSAARKWLGRLPGGLPIAAVVGSGGFAAITGSSLSAVATMGKVAYPELIKNKVDPLLAAGVIGCSGTFAILIPPSAALVFYAIFVEVSVGPLLLAAITPGLITVIIYVLSVMIRVKLNPALCPASEKEVSWRERFGALQILLPVMTIFGSILGSIYFGIATPTEAASLGLVVTLITLVALKRFSFKIVTESVRETAFTTAVILTVILGAMLLTPFLALTGVITLATEFVTGLEVNRYIVLAGITLLYLVLGMLLDALAMLALTLPFTFPIITGLGFHPVWFGVYIVKLVEIALVTPPVGMNIYVLKSIVPENVGIGLLFKSVWPFVICDLFIMVLIVVFPEIPLFLVN